MDPFKYKANNYLWFNKLIFKFELDQPKKQHNFNHQVTFKLFKEVDDNAETSVFQVSKIGIWKLYFIARLS